MTDELPLKRREIVSAVLTGLMIAVVIMLCALIAVAIARSARADTLQNPIGNGITGLSPVGGQGGRNGLASVGGLSGSGGCGIPGDDNGMISMASGVLTVIFSGDTATEITQVANGVRLASQLCNQARMRLLSDMTQIPQWAQDLLDLQGSAYRTGNMWGAAAAGSYFDRLYPSMQGFSAEQIVAYAQAQHQQELASERGSKVYSGQLIEQVSDLSGQLAQVEAQLAGCKAAGQTCTGDVTTQAVTLTAQLQAKRAMLSAVQARGSEAARDYAAASEERTQAWTRLNWAGYDRYGGTPNDPAPAWTNTPAAAGVVMDVANQARNLGQAVKSGNILSIVQSVSPLTQILGQGGGGQQQQPIIWNQ